MTLGSRLRGPSEEVSAEKDTAQLLEEAAVALGFTASVRPPSRSPGRARARRFVLRKPGRTYRLQWPPVRPIYKSEIPGLVDGLGALRSVDTRGLRPVQEPPWLPCCLKPDDGSLGEGFVALRRRDEWGPALRGLPRDRPYVVQPFLCGVEYRVTACWDGQYAVARLDGRRGRWSLWADATGDLPTSWMHDFITIARRLEAPGLGFDMIDAGGEPHVLDVNAAPNLAIHLVTGNPRSVPQAFLESWLTMRDAADAIRPAASSNGSS